MKNGLYIFPCGYENNTKEYSGVLKKIDMQCAELSKHFSIRFFSAYESKHDEAFYKFTKRLPWNSADRKYDDILQQMDNTDFVYIRRTTADKAFLQFLQKTKEAYPKCKIIIEVYTYPYEKDEYKSLPGKFLMIKDKYYRRKYKNCVDRIVTYTNDERIFGIQTIQTINGVDTNKFTAITPRSHDEEIHLLAVAMFQKHHGYERIIEGLHRYYTQGGNRVVKLYLVGTGPEIELYKSLTEKYSIFDKVYFCGSLQGNDLNIAYNNADIGLGSFGFYKIGLKSASSLKTKEYLAKGLPVVAGCVESFVDKEGKQYYLDFPNDDSPIDIFKILLFYDSVYNKENISKQQIANNIHSYAVRTVSMEEALKPVVKYILS